MIKPGSWATGLSPAVTGVVISTLAGAAASLVLWLLTERVTNPKTADRAVVLFCFFPAAFVMSMVYARWAVAGLTAALAGLVRPNGLVLTVCCVWAAVQAIRQHRSWWPVVAPLLAPAGILAFLGYLYLRTGDALAYVHTQKRGWDQGFDFGVSNLRSALAIVASRRIEVYVLVMAACLVGIAVALPPRPLAASYPAEDLCRRHLRHRGPEQQHHLNALSSNTTSMPRFLLAAFPVLIPISRQLPDNAYPVVGACSAALMVTLFWVTSLASWLTP